MGTIFLAGPVVMEQEVMVLHSQFRLDIRKACCNEGAKTLEQSAQREGGCPMPGNSQGRVGQDAEQPDRVDFPALCRVI